MKHPAVSSRIFFNVAAGVPSIPDALPVFAVPTVSFNEGISGLQRRLLRFALFGSTFQVKGPTE